MKIFDFISKFDVASKNISEKAKLLCFYHKKECGECLFTMALISSLFVDAGFNAPNASRLKGNLIKGRTKAFLLSKTNKSALEFIPAILQEMESSLGHGWIDTVTIVSDSELIEEIKFCGQRYYLTQLIKQINSSYKNNCFDACAVLMRRLFEVLLILAYQNLNIDSEIKVNDEYFMLDNIVKNAVINPTLKLSRNKKYYDRFRKVGNFSAHNITYIAGKKDIDDIKIEYRVMLEELFNKAGLI